MRQQYTCIFKRTLSSRVWALTPAERCVWLWLQLSADPEGFVPTDVTGVALGARVTGDEARTALELLALVDADADPDDPFEGRIIERVKGGWRVLGFEQSRETAKAEGRRARTRQYMRNARARVANDVTPSDPVASTVTPPIPKPKPRTVTLSEEGNRSPAGGVAFVGDGVSVGYDAPVIETPPPRLHAIPDAWQPSESLRAAATMAGVTDLDERLAGLRSGPIGGHRGVFESGLEAYIKSHFGKWKAWAETDRAKARAAVAAPPSSRRQFIPPTPEPKEKHKRMAARWGIDLSAAVERVLATKVHENGGEQSFIRALERDLALQAKAIRDARAA